MNGDTGDADTIQVEITAQFNIQKALEGAHVCTTQLDKGTNGVEIYVGHLLLDSLFCD